MNPRFCVPLLVIICAASFSEPARAQPKPPFQLRDGDRVVLLGDTLIEREQLYGFLEHRLTVQFPDRNIVFRNLGWSADTPAGISRASFDFDKPGKAFEKLKEHLAAVRPSVVFLGYGMANSLEDLQAGQSHSSALSAGLAKFKADLNRLMDAIQSLNTNGTVRFVLLSPV